MKLYTISCDPMCGFVVTSHDKTETMSLAGQHVAKNHPDVKMTPQQAEAQVKVTG